MTSAGIYAPWQGTVCALSTVVSNTEALISFHLFLEVFMKKVFALLAVTVLLGGSVGCSSSNKKAEEPVPESTVTASEEIMNEPEIAAEEPAPIMESTPAPEVSNLSLGSGSSGRGH